MLAVTTYRFCMVSSNVNRISKKEWHSVQDAPRQSELPRTGSLNNLPVAVDIPLANRINDVTE